MPSPAVMQQPERRHVALQRDAFVGRQPADQCRGRSEMRDAVPLDQTRHARPIGEVRSAVVANQRGAPHQGARHHERSRDPAHVRRPAEDITALDVEVDRGIVGDFQREAAMRVHSALGLSGRSRRVDDHERIVGIHGRGRGAISGAGSDRRANRRERSRGSLARAPFQIRSSSVGKRPRLSSISPPVSTHRPRRLKPV